MKIMDLDEFLAKKGLYSPLSDYLYDETKFPDCQKKLHDDDYHDQRKEAIKEYQLLVNKGILRPRNSIEITITMANGDPDNESTQVARRICDRYGWNWRKGERL